MDHDDVDFVVTSSAGGVDEELPEPLLRSWSRRTRIGVGLAGLAVVGGLVLAATHGSTPTAGPRTPVPSPTSTGATFEPRIIADPTPFDRPQDVVGLDPSTGVAPCPQAGDGQSACQSGRAVAPAVRAAIRQHFPGARVRTELDQILRDVGFGSGGLWYRRVTAVAGRLEITVVVRKPLPEDVSRGDSRIVGGREEIFETTGSSGYTVSVRVSAPTDHSNISGAIDLLVSDQRLLRVA